jgi:hypothetical protein
MITASAMLGRRRSFRVASASSVQSMMRGGGLLAISAGTVSPFLRGVRQLDPKLLRHGGLGQVPSAILPPRLLS